MFLDTYCITNMANTSKSTGKSALNYLELVGGFTPLETYLGVLEETIPFICFIIKFCIHTYPYTAWWFQPSEKYESQLG